jgi:predicted AAA+ superfamily ATPase
MLPHSQWQDVPEIWDEVRYRVDETRNHPGQFILTGSSEPQKERLHHSGAGRIATYRMSTMTLAEMGASSGTVSLAGLFDGNFTPVLAQQGLETYAGHICRGGWPATS